MRIATSKNYIILMLCVSLIFAAILFVMKKKINAFQDEIATLDTQIKDRKMDIHILNAELALQKNPERIEALANKYLKLRHVRHGDIKDDDQQIFDGKLKCPQKKK